VKLRRSEGVKERRSEGEKVLVFFFDCRKQMMERIRTHHDLRVFQLSFEAGMEILR
jgi:uncharacterized protein (DUF58 family)